MKIQETMGLRRTCCLRSIMISFSIFMEQGILYVYSVIFFINGKGRSYMKFQWNLLLGLLFAIIIAVFAVSMLTRYKSIMCLAMHSGHLFLLF